MPPTLTPQILFDKLCQVMRVGFVNARMPEKMRVKVTLKDMPGGALVTDWLPVLTPRASQDMQYDLPDIGDQVLCFFLPYGHEQGFVAGAMYGKQTPPVQNGEKWHRTFKDGTYLEYDRANHKLTANVKGDVEIVATGKMTASTQGPTAIASENHISLSAPSMNLGGSGGGATAAAMQGNFQLTQGDMVAETISLRNHVHTCPACGSPTSPPIA